VIGSYCCSNNEAVAAATTLANHCRKQAQKAAATVIVAQTTRQFVFFSHFKGKRSRTREDTSTDIGSGTLQKIADYLCIDLVGCTSHFAVKCQPARIDLSHRPGDVQTPEIVVNKQPDKIYTRCEDEEPVGGIKL
jgi:hypothetical protein